MKKTVLFLAVLAVGIPLGAYLILRGPGICRGEPLYGWSSESAWMAALESSDPAERQRAANRLGVEKTYHSRSIIPALGNALTNDEDKDVRYASAEALRFIAERVGPKASSAVPALRQGLKDSYWATVASCARSLAAIGPDAKEAVPELLQATERYANGEMSGAPEFCLNTLGVHAVPGLAAALADPAEEGVAMLGPPRVRHAKLLADIAAKIGPEARAAVPACTKGLTDKNVDFRTQCAIVLRFVEKDSETAIPALVLAMRRDLDWEKGEAELSLRKYYREVAMALAKVGPNSNAAINALQETAADRNHLGRLAAEEALREIKSKK